MDITFTQAFWHRLMPFNHEVTLGAMRQFDMAAYKAHAPLAAAGALVASAILYAIGVWLRRMPSKVSTEVQQGRIEELRLLANGWLPYLLVLGPTPVGGIIIVAAGFFGTRARVAGAVLVAAEMAWRISPFL